MKRWLRGCFALLLALCLTAGSALAAGREAGYEPASAGAAFGVAAPEAFPSKLTLNVGEKAVLDGKALSGGRKVKYTSSDKGVASVSATGVVKAKKAGSATITCTLKGKKLARCKVKVTEPVVALTLNRSEAVILLDETCQLSVEPADAEVSWSSSKPEVAKVDENGLVTGIAKGTAAIIAAPKYGKKVKCKVKVAEPVVELKLNMSEASIEIGKTCQLSVEPAGAEVSWSSSKPEVAKVDENGLVTGIATGTAAILVEPRYGKKVKCKVKVTEVYDDLDESLKQIEANGFEPRPEAEDKILSMLNEYRVENGVPALLADEELNKAARVRAFELSRKFGHTRPDGRKMGSVSPLASFENCGVKAKGAFYGPLVIDDEEIAGDMMTLWANSAATRGHALNPKATRVGVGVVIERVYDPDGYYAYGSELFSTK